MSDFRCSTKMFFAGLIFAYSDFQRASFCFEMESKRIRYLSQFIHLNSFQIF